MGTNMNGKEHGTVQGAVANLGAQASLPAGSRSKQAGMPALPGLLPLPGFLLPLCTVPNNGYTESSTQNRNHAERHRQTRRAAFPRRPKIARIGSNDALAGPSRILLRLPQAPFHRPLRDRFRLGAVQRRSQL